MRCECGGRTSVVDSRNTDDNKCVRRRRLCEECGARFSTLEIVMQTTIRKPRVKPVSQVFNREKVTKNASARRRIEEMRDLKGEDDGYDA